MVAFRQNRLSEKRRQGCKLRLPSLHAAVQSPRQPFIFFIFQAYLACRLQGCLFFSRGEGGPVLWSGWLEKCVFSISEFSSHKRRASRSILHSLRFSVSIKSILFLQFGNSWTFLVQVHIRAHAQIKFSKKRMHENGLNFTSVNLFCNRVQPLEWVQNQTHLVLCTQYCEREVAIHALKSSFKH